MQNEHTTLAADDGHRISLSVHEPDVPPIGILQILHGLGEHAGRYARFARAANARGFVVGAHNHRGHGPGTETPGFFAEKDGWHRLTSDTLLVHEHLRARHPTLPLGLLGHSMGSYIAQYFAMHHGELLSSLLLSGSTWPSRPLLVFGKLVSRLEAWRHGPRGHSALLDKMFFADFNKAFRPARTDLDWLSRDAAEVDRYIADPLCGGPYTTGLWRDLIDGLYRISSDAAIARVPATLPILITGGAEDPIGGDDGMGKLAMHYAQTGHSRLKVKIYAEGRHEMLNELNREQVTNDWLDWLTDNT